MSRVQHEGARRLLAIIRTAHQRGEALTYTSAAQALGRQGIGEARAVAQMCDLLDAAAARARLPLLALHVVRSLGGSLNADAFAHFPENLRSRIAERSAAWEYSESDYKAIQYALESLSGLGNRKAWLEVRKEVSDSEFYQSIAGIPTADAPDAIDDLGSDRPVRQMRHANVFIRDEAVRRSVLRRANGNCEYCNQPGFLKPDGSRYLETHHIIALADEGADKPSNVIALCADHHREAHFGQESEALERSMVRIVKADLPSLNRSRRLRRST